MLQVKTGAITGTGAAIDVNLGFKPSYVKVINRSNLGTSGNLAALEWFEGMGDDNAVGINVVAEGGTASTVNLINKTSGGITILETSTVQTADPVTVIGFNGFSIPAAFQENGDELYYIAARN